MNNTISLEQAIEMTTLFRNQKEMILGSDYQGRNILPISETFERAAFDKVLAQPGCVGLRIYHGMTEDLQVREIVVGVNANNEDMLPSSTAIRTASTTTEPTSVNEDDDDPTIIEQGVVCPPICPPPSDLNP